MLLVLVFFVLPLGFVVARSVAYVSGASVGLGVGWLTMPLWHDTPAVTSVAGISVALLAVGVLTCLLAWRRSGLPGTSRSCSKAEREARVSGRAEIVDGGAMMGPCSAEAS